MTDEPQGSTRPRLRPFASALHASAASRLHLPLGPCAAHADDVVPPGPLRSVLGDIEHRGDAAFLARLGRRERRRPTSFPAARRCRSTPRPAPAAKCPSVGESSVAPPPDARQPDLEALVLLVGRRRSGGDRLPRLRQVQGAPPLHRAPARFASRAPGFSIARAGGGARRSRRRPGPTRPTREHASATSGAGKQRRTATRVRGRRSDVSACDEVRQRWTPTPRLRTIDSSCHVPFARTDRRSSPPLSSRRRLRSGAPPPMKKPSPSPTLSRPSRITRKVWPS